MNPKVIICGVHIDNVSMDQALALINGWVRSRHMAYIVTPNVDHIVKLRNDAEFRSIYEKATLVLADGVPLLWAARFLGSPLKQKISGSDLMPRICNLAAEKGYRLFLLGGRAGAAEAAKKKLETSYPSIRIAGVYSPSYGFERDAAEQKKIVHLLKESKPDILFVGLGAPKQEKWIAAHYQELEIPVSIGVGVTFEFIAGVLRRAPGWMQPIGLEWFWRFLSEPGRLWRRYLIEDPKFFVWVFQQKLKKNR